MINVTLASNLFVLREGMKHLLYPHSDIRVVTEVTHYNDLINGADDIGKNILVIVQPFYYQDGYGSLLERLLHKWPRLRVLIITKSLSIQQLRAPLRAGAHGLLSSTCAPSHLLEAIRAVSSGKMYINDELSEIIAPAIRSSNLSDRNERLTERELDILERLVSGQRISKIAEDLRISPKTVSSHKLHIMEKTGVRTFSELIQYAIKTARAGAQLKE